MVHFSGVAGITRSTTVVDIYLGLSELTEIPYQEKAVAEQKLDATSSGAFSKTSFEANRGTHGVLAATINQVLH